MTLFLMIHTFLHTFVTTTMSTVVFDLFVEGNLGSMTFNFKIMFFSGYGKIENVCIGLAIIFELCFFELAWQFLTSASSVVVEVVH